MPLIYSETTTKVTTTWEWSAEELDSYLTIPGRDYPEYFAELWAGDWDDNELLRKLPGPFAEGFPTSRSWSMNPDDPMRALKLVTVQEYTG